MILDVNVLVSGALKGGPPSQLVDLWLLLTPLEVLVCPMLLDELNGVLLRPKFARWLDEPTARTYLASIAARATIVDDPVVIPGLTRDPKDDYLVALARESEADYLISGDADLLQLDDPHPPVLTPRQLLDLLDVPPAGLTPPNSAP